jgi:Na+/citrate or Na+/malate symporter
MTSSIKKAFEYELAGIALVPFSIMAVLSVVFLVSGHLQETGIVGVFALMWSLGFVLYAIGENLPVWREYVGGGLIMAFLGSAVVVHFGLIGPEDSEYLAESVIGNRFLYFLLVALVGGTILSVERETLLRSVLGLLPVILFAIGGATICGVIAGVLLGIEPARIVTHYVLPIMSGGNGAGAIPMSEIYADTTGETPASYYGFAISVLTIANIIAILIASALNQLGKRFPALTGEGRLSMKADRADIVSDDLAAGTVTGEPEKELHTVSAIFFAVAMLLLAMLLYAVLPTVHLFAWAVVIFVVINLLDILPKSLIEALKKLNEWGMRTFIVLVLVAVGVMTDLNELIAALTVTNLVISGVIVLGAVLGAGLSARVFSFYPIEAGIAAGLCMANRGGSGDLEVLGASKRMALYPYAQISSRIGGGIVLFLAGYLFSLLL